jgi:hypothetical protein
MNVAGDEVNLGAMFWRGKGNLHAHIVRQERGQVIVSEEER